MDVARTSPDIARLILDVVFVAVRGPGAFCGAGIASANALVEAKRYPNDKELLP